MSALIEGAFELGKVLLETELSKHENKRPAARAWRAGRRAHRAATDRQVLESATMWDRPDGLVVVTTHRLAFLANVSSFTATTEFLSFPLATMANLRAGRVMGLTPAVQFETGGKAFVFTLLAGADEVAAAIQQQRAAA